MDDSGNSWIITELFVIMYKVPDAVFLQLQDPRCNTPALSHGSSTEASVFRSRGRGEIQNPDQFSEDRKVASAYQIHERLEEGSSWKFKVISNPNTNFRMKTLDQ